LNIKQEIVKIINEYDFIVVPGLGAFLAEYSKPYFNAVGDIIAGNRTIHFEPIIKKDIDNKLFNLLVEKISIPQNYVLIEYSDFIEKLSHELKSTGKYDWEGLGSFFQHADGAIDYFGDKTKDTSFQEMSSFKENPAITESKIVESKTSFFEEEKSKPEPILDSSDNHNSKEEFIKSMETTKPFKVLLYMVPFFLLLAGLSYAVFFKPNEKKDVKQSMMAEIDSLSKLQADIEMDSVYKSDPPIQESTYSIDRSTEDSNKTSIEPTQNKKKDTGEIKDRAHGKIIPIGVFSSRETADNVVTKFAESGVPVRTKAYKGKFKVYVVSYSNAQTEEFNQKILELNSFIQ
jgi:CCDC81-like prokaryotic HU domain 1